MSYALGSTLTLVRTRTMYDPLRGAQTVTDYEGTLLGINGLIQTLAPYQRVEVGSADPPIYRCSVTTPELAEAPVFELLANLKEKDITEHPKFETVSEDNLKVLANFMRKPIVGADPAFTGDSDQIDLALELYVLELVGTRKYFTEDYVLRYTVTATNAIQLSLAYSKCDRLFTPTELANASISGITLPLGIADSVSHIPAKPLGVGSVLLWSWLKRAPTARQTTMGKVVITAEWWLDAWNTIVYKKQSLP